MIAYKGFNKDLTCTMGHGTFQYEIGKTYTEEEANCAQNGLHCVEEPIRVLDWYPDGRYCKVKIEDYHEDGTNKISAKKMTILSEMDLITLYISEATWMIKHWDRSYSDRVSKRSAVAEENGIVIVRGKNPRAKGGMGALLILLQEAKKSKKIEVFGVLVVDGEHVLPDKWYHAEGNKYEKG